MQWPFATELSQFTANASSHVGLNLIRGSPAFVYTNHTPQAVLTSAGFLSSPLGPGFTLVQTALGPFGSVEMKRLACPSSLQSLYQNLTKYTTSLLSSSSAIQTAFWTIFTSFTMNPTMKAWNLAQQRGGNLLCELNTAVQSFQDRPAISLSSKGSCATGLFESVIGDTTSMIKALLVLPSLNATATASQEPNNPVGSEAIIRQTWDFVQMVVPLAQRQTLQSQAVHIKRDIRDTVQVSFIQYLYVGNTYVLSAVNYFDPRESEFELYSWLFMFDWAQGLREVILFEGEQGKLTSISTCTTFVQTAVNPMEVPLNVAYYMRWFLQYITWVMLGVACLVCLYIIGLRGQIEASNMISFSRVTSLVWIGRPLIFLRAISAVCLLATSTLQLTQPYSGLVTYFQSIPQPWYMIILTAGELNWMVFIVNDIFSIATRKLTQGYSITSFYLVWIASAIWAFVAPPKRSVVIDRQCLVDQVDYQVVCHGGTIAIGSLSQFTSLIGLVVTCCVVCYIVEWLRQRSLHVKSNVQASYFLYAAAKHQFQTNKWECQGIHYLDKASAVLTGVLSLRYQRHLFIFDIKTWRTYVIPTDQFGLDDPELPRHLAAAIPLTD
ncbi:Aste57867_4148 [Aphanomyces stellatus]|uniref:Aste57867_4148 protein n=1 Tax=Aphanomyces stellatus TaxID=120398 RepID=A0A485KC73_9STRA|nr:hypothetical protein As57867_004137 [Aphanomyces stellatus]VFT81275.1 Aste57867_4148 [Aphanomyces stellatus]